MHNIVEQLTEAIDRQIKAGICLTPDVVHYLESMIGAATAPALEQELKSGDTADTCSLLELLFFPDAARQIALEPLVEKTDLEEGQVNRIKAALCRRPLHTRLTFPDKTVTGPIQVPEAIVCAYVRRLNLLRRIDQQVARNISGHIADRKQALGVRVVLRNSRVVFSPQVVSFLCAFFRILPEKSNNWAEALALAVDLLESADARTDIYSALMDKKRHYAEMIRKSENSAQQLQQIPVEAMIMSGASIACMDAEEIRRKMALIDETALYVFGKTQNAQIADQPVTLTF